MKTIKYSALLFLLSMVNLYGQSTFPEIIPKSPEVMGLESYGEYPVSEYTGIPSINIPLYTAKIKDFEFPISLDYHANGIQVTQEATWVGLGWNLLADGCISVTAIGAIDGSEHYVSAQDWTDMLNYSKPYWQKTGMSDGVPDFFPSLDLTSSKPNNLLDVESLINNENRQDIRITKEAKYGSGERDIYNVSLLGRSFKFSIHPTKGTYIYNGEKNKCEIEKQGNSWFITDEYGYQYIFTDKDRESINISGQYNNPQVSWFLSQIVYQGNSLVKINYIKSAKVQKLPTLSESCDYLNGNQYRVYRSSIYTEPYAAMYISSIITPLDSIVFTTGSRTDMRGALKLQEMKVIDRSSKALRKKYEFKYDYFTGSSTGMDGMLSVPDYVKKRLKLTEIIQWDNTSGKSVKYALAYNESPALPCKTSFSQDLWGYYNGYRNSYSGKFNCANCASEFYSNINTLLPNPNLIKGEGVAPCLLDFDGANRSVDKYDITAGVLKSITYPTGGKTEFEFEPNMFSNITYLTAESISSGGYNIGDNGYPSFYSNRKSAMFELERKVTADVEVTIAGKDYDVTKMDNFYVTITVAMASNTSKTYKYAIITNAQKQEFNKNKTVTIKEKIDLPVGRVNFVTHIDPNLPNPKNYTLTNGVVGKLHYTYVNTNATGNGTSLGGGLRIKKITNYTDKNTIASIKRYNYVTKDGKTSGKLIHPMKFTDRYFTNEKIYQSIGSGVYYNTFDRINSFNVWNYSTSGNEATVGYDRVEVENLSLDEKSATGKKIVEFNNKTIDNAFPALCIFIPKNKTASILNGKMISTMLLNRNKDTISVEKYTYEVEDMVKNFINIRQMEWRANTPVLWGELPVLPVLMVYPTTNYVTYMKKKEEISYFGTKKINKITDFEYDTKSYNVKKITETIDGKKKITEYKYGVENSALSSYNMISVPIKETVSINNTPIQAKTMGYAAVNSGMALSSVSIQNGSSAAETRLKYEKYDKFGNPVYITKDGVAKIVYIFGYNYQYPIAEIKNCTYAQLTAIIPETDLDNIAKKLAPATADMTKINNLRDNASLKDAFITTYWYQPLVGLIQVRDPSKKDIYFEYDTFNRLKNSYIMENGTKKIVEGYDYYIK